MVAYDIDVLPLIKRPKVEYPDATQPWYTGNAGAPDMLDNIGLYFNVLKRKRSDHAPG